MTTPSSIQAQSNVSEIADLLDSVIEHPELAKLLSDFRRNAFAILDRSVTELVSKLGEEDRTTSRAAVINSANIHLLTTASRQSARTVKTRRQFARDILIAGLYNQSNPEWDMTDASTYQTDADDLITLLMQRPDPLHGKATSN